MPTLEITTNVRRENIPRDFLLNLLPVFGQAMNRREEVLFVTLVPDVTQVFDIDDSSPTIVASVSSIGLIGPEENKVTARALTDFMEKELGVHRDRILLSFINMEAHNVARAGNTFA